MANGTGVVIDFTPEEVEALHSMLFDTCLYTTSKRITYGHRISAANKIFKSKEKLDEQAKRIRKANRKP